MPPFGGASSGGAAATLALSVQNSVIGLRGTRKNGGDQAVGAMCHRLGLVPFFHPRISQGALVRARPFDCRTVGWTFDHLFPNVFGLAGFGMSQARQDAAIFAPWRRGLR